MRYLELIIAFFGGIAFVITGTVIAQTLPYGLFPDVEEGSYYADSVTRMAQKGIIKGFPTGEFKPHETVTRGQLATVLDRFDRQIVGQLRDQIEAMAGSPLSLGERDGERGSNNPPYSCSNNHLPGDRYNAQDSCNICYCTQEGEFCTEMACENPLFPKERDGERGSKNSNLENNDTSYTPSPLIPLPKGEGASDSSVPPPNTECQDQKKRLDDLFEKYRSCQNNSDCAVYIHDCSPYLTCGKPVTENALSNIERIMGPYEEACRGEEPIACALCVPTEVECVNNICTLKERLGGIEETCTKYLRNGKEVDACAICGNSICEQYEQCTSSNCWDGRCTKDCGGLYCPGDCLP
jgi:hypothetical protein